MIPDVPLFYVVNRHLQQDQAGAVLSALSITPVCCAVISNVLDVHLALSLSDEIVRTASDEAAFEVAAQVANETQRAVLVLGEADVLDAVYADGRRSAVVNSC